MNALPQGSKVICEESPTDIGVDRRGGIERTGRMCRARSGLVGTLAGEKGLRRRKEMLVRDRGRRRTWH